MAQVQPVDVPRRERETRASGRGKHKERVMSRLMKEGLVQNAVRFRVVRFLHLVYLDIQYVNGIRLSVNDGSAHSTTSAASTSPEAPVASENRG